MACSVQVSNLAPSATEQTLREFFSYSGTVEAVLLTPAGEAEAQTATVTFSAPDAIDTAIMLSGATILDREINVTALNGAESPAKKSRSAGEVVAALLAQGYALSIDIISRAKAFDEQHQLTSRAAAKISELDAAARAAAADADAKMGFSEKMKELNEQYKVGEKVNAMTRKMDESAREVSKKLNENETFQKGMAAAKGAASSFGEGLNKFASNINEKVSELRQQPK